VVEEEAVLEVATGVVAQAAEMVEAGVAVVEKAEVRVAERAVVCARRRVEVVRVMEGGEMDLEAVAAAAVAAATVRLLGRDLL
jgi:hypothetical protein